MYLEPSFADPVDVAYERIFLELPTSCWRRYDFKAMSHAERKAAAMLVRAGAAELHLRCSLQIPSDSTHKLRAMAVVSGDYMHVTGMGQSLEAAMRSTGHCLPGWKNAPHVVYHAYKVALRLTADGERTRLLHHSGVPDVLWRLPTTVPGQVVLEKVKMVAHPEAATKSSPAPTTARASVGDINVTVNVSPSQVVVMPVSSDVPRATDDAKANAEPPEPFFTVKYWSELAIGIDGHWRFWAQKPAPGAGGRFTKADACELKLPGKRWRTLLELLASSPSGNQCDAATLAQELEYLPPTSTLPRDRRARQGSLEPDLRSDLSKRIAPALKLLKSNVGDLARDLRKQIKGPKGRDRKAALRIDGQTVRSEFVVGFLVSDEQGHLFFRHDLS